MRLLLVSSEFPPGPGGIGTHAYQLTRHLAALGWEAMIATAQDHATGTQIAAFNAQSPFPIERFWRMPAAPLKAAQRWFTVKAALRRFEPDVVIATGARAVWVTAGAITGGQPPLVAIGHGSEFALPAGWERAAVRWAYSRAQTVICVSRYTWKEMVRSGVDVKAGTVIPNGADATQYDVPEESPADVLTELGISPGPILVTVGNVTVRKGQEVVIRSLPEIVKYFPKVRYLIIGLPTERVALETLASELGVSANVCFLGVQPGEVVRRVLSVADIFVMTSRRTAWGDFEGFGIAVVEAALCATPAIVSNSGGLPEAIIEGETGLAVEENNPHSTAEGILALLRDPVRRREMGLAACRHANSSQTWLRRVAEYDDVLRSLVSAARNRTPFKLQPTWSHTP